MKTKYFEKWTMPPISVSANSTLRRAVKLRMHHLSKTGPRENEGLAYLAINVR